jgi:hypothetical protein
MLNAAPPRSPAGRRVDAGRVRAHRTGGVHPRTGGARACGRGAVRVGRLHRAAGRRRRARARRRAAPGHLHRTGTCRSGAGRRVRHLGAAGGAGTGAQPSHPAGAGRQGPAPAAAGAWCGPEAPGRARRRGADRVPARRGVLASAELRQRAAAAGRAWPAHGHRGGAAGRRHRRPGRRRGRRRACAARSSRPAPVPATRSPAPPQTPTTLPRTAASAGPVPASALRPLPRRRRRLPRPPLTARGDDGGSSPEPHRPQGSQPARPGRTRAPADAGTRTRTPSRSTS